MGDFIVMRLGTSELFLILLVVVIIFGPKQIPKLMKLCKKGVAKVRKALDDDDDENETDTATASKE